MELSAARTALPSGTHPASVRDSFQDGPKEIVYGAIAHVDAFAAPSGAERSPTNKSDPDTPARNIAAPVPSPQRSLVPVIQTDDLKSDASLRLHSGSDARGSPLRQLPQTEAGDKTVPAFENDSKSGRGEADKQPPAEIEIAPNLRAALPASKFAGVARDETTGRWCLDLGEAQPGGSGLYDTEEEAARAYDRVAPRLLGSSAPLNFPAAEAPRKRRGLAAYDSDPEISADSDCGSPNAVQDVDDEIVGQVKAGEKERKKPNRRKRPRLVPPHSRSSRFRGVYWEPKGSKWYSSISSNHKQIHLGSFNTEEEAAQAFDQEAIRLRGPATFTNFPRDTYSLEGNEAAAIVRQRVMAKRPPNAVRRRTTVKVDSDEEWPEAAAAAEGDSEDREAVQQQAVPVASPGRPEKDDQAANALLSLGNSIPHRPAAQQWQLQQPTAPSSRSLPPNTIEPPVTLRAQKRKRSQPGISPAVRTDGAGRARSKFTGVYQQSRGHGWFASICVDKSMRYLGTFATEEEAARAFDQEAIRLRGTGIELNLPHEAEGFMQKLKEEEEANGGPIRVGPAPVVSAGPDFEDQLAHHSALNARFGRESSAEPEQAAEDPGAVPRRMRSRERPAALRSRRMMGQLAAAHESPSPSPEVESEDEREAVLHDSLRVPNWRGRRPRSVPIRTLRTDQKSQEEASHQAALRHVTAAIDATAAAPLPGVQQMPHGLDAALSGYLSMLNPTISRIAGANSLGDQAAVPLHKPVTNFHGDDATSALLSHHVTRPAAGYFNSSSLQSIAPALGVTSAWPQTFAQPGGFLDAANLAAAAAVSRAGSLPQRPQPSFGHVGVGAALGADGTPDLQSILGGFQAATPLTHLLARASQPAFLPPQPQAQHPGSGFSRFTAPATGRNGFQWPPAAFQGHVGAAYGLPPVPLHFSAGLPPPAFDTIDPSSQTRPEGATDRQKAARHPRIGSSVVH